MNGYINLSGIYYEADTPLDANDCIVTLRPKEEGIWFYRKSVNTWEKDKRSEGRIINAAEYVKVVIPEQSIQSNNHVCSVLTNKTIPIKNSTAIYEAKAISNAIAKDTHSKSTNCPNLGNCPIGETLETCPPSVQVACKTESIKERLLMGNTKAVNDTSGYNWSIKELLPFIITILLGLGGVVGTYVRLSNDIVQTTSDVLYLKSEQAVILKKMEEQSKAIEGIKTQLTELTVLILRGKGN